MYNMYVHALFYNTLVYETIGAKNGLPQDDTYGQIFVLEILSTIKLLYYITIASSIAYPV